MVTPKFGASWSDVRVALGILEVVTGVSSEDSL